MDWQETATLRESWDLEGAIWLSGRCCLCATRAHAHVENDLPYSEILTAAPMVNWFTQQVFRSDVEVGSFDDPKYLSPGETEALSQR